MSIYNIEYRFSNPASYTAFVPGLSYIVQKTQMAALKALPQEDSFQASKTFARSIRWHLCGSLTQAAVYAIASQTFPILGLVAFAAIGQCVYTLHLSKTCTFPEKPQPPLPAAVENEQHHETVSPASTVEENEEVIPENSETISTNASVLLDDPDMNELNSIDQKLTQVNKTTAKVEKFLAQLSTDWLDPQLIVQFTQLQPQIFDASDLYENASQDLSLICSTMYDPNTMNTKKTRCVEVLNKLEQTKKRLDEMGEQVFQMVQDQFPTEITELLRQMTQ